MSVTPRIVAALLASACSSPSFDPAEASTPADSAVDGSRDAASGGCNDLVGTAAPLVTMMHSPASPPTASGGAIAPGLYVETAGTRYDGMTGVYGSGKQIVRLKDSAFDQLINGGSSDSRYSGTWLVNGSVLTMTSTCPQKGTPTSFGYTATSSEVRLYITEGQAVLEVVLTKQ